MEQHKVLLIIVAVTIVLAAVIGVGIWLFYPRGGEAAGSLAQGPAESTGFEWEPLDYLSGESGFPGLEEGPAEEPDEFEVFYGVAEEPDATTTRIPGGDSAVAERPSDGAARQTAPDFVVRSDGAAERTSVSSAPAGDGARRDDVAVAAPRPEAPRPESARRDSTPSIRSTAPGNAGKDSSADDPEVTNRSYWVQVISSPNRDTAEQAQQTMDDHQLGTRILTKQIDGKTYYRLRLGPFPVRAEAEKFLGWVQDIDGFGGSMIFVDYSTPTIAAVAR